MLEHLIEHIGEYMRITPRLPRLPLPFPLVQAHRPSSNSNSPLSNGGSVQRTTRDEEQQLRGREGRQLALTAPSPLPPSLPPFSRPSISAAAAAAAMEGQKKGLKSRPTAADDDDGRTQRSLTVRGGERTSSSRRTSRVLYYMYVRMYAPPSPHLM